MVVEKNSNVRYEIEGTVNKEITVMIIVITRFNINNSNKFCFNKKTKVILFKQ